MNSIALHMYFVLKCLHLVLFVFKFPPWVASKNILETNNSICREILVVLILRVELPFRIFFDAVLPFLGGAILSDFYFEKLIAEQQS